MRSVEAERVPGSSALTEAVAFSLFKLMAYKDEYEVARLHRDPAFRRELADRYGDDAAYHFMLHPPVLKALGMDRKIAVPAAAGQVMFGALAPLKRLRGTKLDVFGRDHVRVIERELIAEYEALLDEICARLDERNHAVAVELAALPDLVRGYDEVKLGNVATYRTQMQRLRAHLADGELDSPVLELLPTPDVTPARPVRAAARRAARAAARAAAAAAARGAARVRRDERDRHANLEWDAAVEGRLEPSTAALMEGVPPAGSGGRLAPPQRAASGAHTTGPAEDDTEHLPG